MSIKIMTRVWAESKAKSSKLLLLLAIADFADDNGFAWPGMDTLAEKIRMTTQSVRNLTQDLMQAGELVKISRADQGRTNLYIVMTGITDEELKSARDKAEQFGGGQIFLPPKCILGGGKIAVIGGGKIAVIPDPSVSVIESSSSALPEEGKAPPQEEKEASLPKIPFYLQPNNDYLVKGYYKDRSVVTIIGTANNGPWGMKCPACRTPIQLSEIDEYIMCLCGLHELAVTKIRPESKVKRLPEAVEAYYAIVKSKGVRYHSQDQELEDKIANTVTDIPFWRQVIIEYLVIMLKYYTEHRLPGTRKGEEGGGETTTSEQPPGYEVTPPEVSEEELAEFIADLKGGVI
jgi:hypothetical protein